MMPAVESESATKAAIIPEMATVEEIERSISPQMITIVIPNAITPLNAALLKIPRILGTVKKPGAINAITMQITSKMISIICV